MQHIKLGKAQDRKPEVLASWLVLYLATIWPWQVHGFSLLSYLSSWDNTVYPIAWDCYEDQMWSTENNEEQIEMIAKHKVTLQMYLAPRQSVNYLLKLIIIWPKISILNQILDVRTDFLLQDNFIGWREIFVRITHYKDHQFYLWEKEKNLFMITMLTSLKISELYHIFCRYISISKKRDQNLENLSQQQEMVTNTKACQVSVQKKIY